MLALLGYIHGLSLTSCDRRQPKHPLPHEKLMAFSLFSQSPSTILKKSETQSVRSLCTPYTPESLFPSLRYLTFSHCFSTRPHRLYSKNLRSQSSDAIRTSSGYTKLSQSTILELWSHLYPRRILLAASTITLCGSAGSRSKNASRRSPTIPCWVRTQISRCFWRVTVLHLMFVHFLPFRLRCCN